MVRGFTSFPTIASLTKSFRPVVSPSPSMTFCTSEATCWKTSLKILHESPPLFSSPHSW